MSDQRYRSAQISKACFLEGNYIRILRHRGISGLLALGVAENARNHTYSLPEACQIGIAANLSAFGFSAEEAFAFASSRSVADAVSRALRNEPAGFIGMVRGGGANGSWSNVVQFTVSMEEAMSQAWSANDHFPGTRPVESVQFHDIARIVKRVSILLAGSNGDHDASGDGDE